MSKSTPSLLCQPTCQPLPRPAEHAVSQDLCRRLNLVGNALRPWPSHCLVLTSFSATPQIECQPECRLVLRPEHLLVCHKCLAVRLCKNKCQQRYRSEVLHTHRKVSQSFYRFAAVRDSCSVSATRLSIFRQVFIFSLLFSVSDLV